MQERIYRHLLGEGPCSHADLRRATGIASPDLNEVVRSLEDSGLLSRSAHRRPLLVAAPPDVALEALFARRQEELDASRVAAAELVRDFRNLQTGENARELVEIVGGRRSITQRYVQMQRTSKREVLFFDQPPYAGGGGQNYLEIELLRQGVQYRVIYDRAALEWPGQIEMLQEVIRAGEEARMVEQLPMKLAIADKRLAMLPLRRPGNREDVPQRIMVHPSPLLDALVGLFEMTWDRATPILDAPKAVRLGGAGSEGLSDADRRLLMLLAADLKDDAIGRQLGIKRRAVQRRLRRLMDKVGVDSRLHLVVHAVRKGWIATEKSQ